MSVSSETISRFADATMSMRSDSTPASSPARPDGGTSLPARGVHVWPLVTAPATAMGVRWRVTRRGLPAVPQGGVGTHRHDLPPGRGGLAAHRHLTSLLVDIATVYLAYATDAGHAVIDRELYLPRSWIDDPERCRAAGVPDEVGSTTKPKLATTLICRALGARGAGGVGDRRRGLRQQPHVAGRA